jgi:hypothetical protein
LIVLRKFLAAPGPSHTLSNVAPAWASCNASKCNAEVTTWMRRVRLDEAAFLVRQLQIVQAISGDCARVDEDPCFVPDAAPTTEAT